MEKAPVYYGDYLQLDKILSAQDPESAKLNIRADDEMLFIIIHQTYELWFKQIMHELQIVEEVFSKNTISENSPDLYNAVHRLKRITTILNILVQQIDILETMTPLDFLDFRDLLRPASGFQSYQFKLLEAKLGLKFEHRHGQSYYTSQLRKEDLDKVKSLESQRTIIDLVNDWLCRMPFFEQNEYWRNYRKQFDNNSSLHDFWNDYRTIYKNSLSEAELGNLEVMDKLFFNKEYPEERSFGQKANRSMLFIMLYRDFPILQLPFQLLNTLLDIDELLSQWRYRHINMVQRMIGTRTGTGGSTGKDYLKGALDKHYIYKEIAEMTSFLIQRSKLPKLSPELNKSLGF